MRIDLRNRETLLTLALVIGLAALTIVSAVVEGGDDAALPLDSSSTAPNGARALFRWLEALGYGVGDEVGDDFAVPDGTDLVFLLEPAGLTAEEVETLTGWVDEGGTLVYAGRFYGGTPLLSSFEIERGFAGETAAALAPALPLLTDPPVLDPVPMETDSYFEVGFPDFVPIAATADGPVVVVFDHGNGRVILSAATGPFTNAGLKLPGASAFVLNLVREAPAGAQVWFDEWHHGRRPVVAGPAGPGDWLRRTAAGRAVLYAAGTIFVWIALSGRAFGRPVSPAHGRSRRAPLEYITAIAGLNQRAGNRADLLAHYHRRLKQALAARYRLDPRIPDGEFIEALGRYDPDADLAALSELLSELRNPRVTEPEMVRLAAQATDVMISKK